MRHAKQLVVVPGSHCLELIAVFFAAAGLSLVIAISFVGGSTPQARRPAAIPAATRASAAAAIRAPSSVHAAVGEYGMYDDGWAGGPGPTYHPTIDWELYRGWRLYDDGWAGGPGPSSSWPTPRP